MPTRSASDVAKRCLCIELLLQRLGLEIDDDDPQAERDAVRVAWLSRTRDLGVDDELAADERALLERPVDQLTEVECDDIEARTIRGLALLWALGRLPTPPTAALLGDATALVADHGVLGDGSIAAAKATIASAALRPDSELEAALAAATKTRDDSFLGGPEHMVAALVVEALSPLHART